jgi:hypothetical protein
MKYFDFHVHPSLKGGISIDPRSYNAWNTFELYREVRGILKKFRQIIDSQANLTQIEKRSVLSVVALIGMETAFADNFVIQKILGSRIVSPLSRKLLRKVAAGEITYYKMFRRDLDQLLLSKKIKEFKIISTIDELDPILVNVVLSVEGAHSFQNEPDKNSESDKGKSILSNFQKFKDEQKYRLHHLTLIHLTRQIACVHCFGVRIKMLGINLTPDVRFQPDPGKKGISEWGEKIITLAYDSTKVPLILIDIKHMSYLSRTQFYKMRINNKWTNIPLVVSHAGITGTSFSSAPIKKIKPAKSAGDCDEVIWYQKKGLCGTFFNPWTINLFDEDILEVLRSSGLIGISLDQRVIGYGKIFGEFMSPLEVKELNLHSKISPTAPPDFITTYDEEEETGIVFDEFMLDPEVREILKYEEWEEEDLKITETEEKKLGGEMLFDLDEPDSEFKNDRASHIDYLANNILHIIKTGLQNGFDGSKSKPDVLNCICLGSDLDGIVDAMNFPYHAGETTIDERNWITIDEYDQLEEGLKLSMERCIASDPFLSAQNLNINAIVSKVMTKNGPEFLKRNFTKTKKSVGE